ncbi:MAG TPA: hypothetical protein VIG49_09925, partial [Acetobacteraceae bacterium]
MHRTVFMLWRARLPVLVLLFLGALSGGDGATADEAAPDARASAPVPASLPAKPAPSPQPAGSNCPQRPVPIEGAPSNLIVELAPDTLWRPRGAEVRFTIRGGSDTAGVREVRVCFGWEAPTATDVPDRFYALRGSPLVRSIFNDTGIPQYGAVVPVLDDIPGSDWWGQRFVGRNVVSFTGLYMVPVADMVVEVTTGDGAVARVSLPVGVTSVSYAWVLVAVVLAGFWVAVAYAVRDRNVPGRQLVLRLIATRDGYASLSQFQIMLWAIVVGLSAVYVMVLSGNLISITPGTLTLLGIASVAALLGRIPATNQPGSGGQTDGAVATAPELRVPRWSDLVVADVVSREIDVTRVQMLIFTLISAAFVTLKVVVSYEIPTIPDTFLLLMGISNGVYVTGRHI